MFCFACANDIFICRPIFFTVVESGQEAVSIAGGIVLFLISLRMIFPTEKGIMGEIPAGEPFFILLAVPFLAGLSTLAMLIFLPDLNQTESLNG
jgi:multiple antibiotic resistance protein